MVTPALRKPHAETGRAAFSSFGATKDERFDSHVRAGGYFAPKTLLALERVAHVDGATDRDEKSEVVTSYYLGRAVLTEVTGRFGGGRRTWGSSTRGGWSTLPESDPPRAIFRVVLGELCQQSWDLFFFSWGFFSGSMRPGAFS